MCEEGHNDPPLFSFYLDTDGETIGIAVAMLGRVAELIRILCPPCIVLVCGQCEDWISLRHTLHELLVSDSVVH